MSTNMKGFEELFLARLEELLAQRHPQLALEVPTSGSRARGPRADFVISNPKTGSAIAGELKGGKQGQHLPFSMLPQLRALREQIRTDHPARGEVVVITTGKVPNLVRDGLNHDGIAILNVSSPEEGAERLNECLDTL